MKENIHFFAKPKLSFQNIIQVKHPNVWKNTFSGITNLKEAV